MAKKQHAPEITGEREPWIKEASCRDLENDLFYPFGEGRWYTTQIEAAKAVCASCKVIDICLQTALDRSEYGIWGGTTEGERKQIKKLRQPHSA